MNFVTLCLTGEALGENGANLARLTAPIPGEKEDKEKAKPQPWQHGALLPVRIILPKYFIARYPVTVAQFRAFVETAKYKPKDPDCLRGVDNHPVVSVTYHDAMAYCDWLTEQLREWPETPEPLASLIRSPREINALNEKESDISTISRGNKGWRITLPSEAEWEKAARGSSGNGSGNSNSNSSSGGKHPATSNEQPGYSPGATTLTRTRQTTLTPASARSARSAVSRMAEVRLVAKK